jgi:hypothetical protein
MPFLAYILKNPATLQGIFHCTVGDIVGTDTLGGH